MRFIIFLFLIVTSLSAMAEGNLYFCSDKLESLPIQQNGRIKPLYVHSYEVMKELTGHSRYENMSNVIAYCLLSARGMGLANSIDLKAPIEQVKVQKFLNLPVGEKSIRYEDLISMQEQVKMEMRSTKENDSYKKALTKLVRQISLYKDIVQGTNWMLAENEAGVLRWQPLIAFLTEEKVKKAQEMGSVNPFETVFFSTMNTYEERIGGNKIQMELFYAKAGLVQWSLGLTIFAIALLILSRKKIFGKSVMYLTALTQIVLIGLRIYISGRAPITNMYETVLSSGTGGLIFAIILDMISKDSIYLIIGLVYNTCALLMINFANGMLSATISPLVPVLRDNFWLSTHVTTVILSYGALALSWLLANYVIVKKWFSSLSKSEEKYFTEKIYTILKWGTTLLAAGIILGGVWADYSWGRFWGWDPKETWSLIVLCIYMAILHGRYTSWIKEKQFFIYTALAFISVMMAWFGVNYILATGLHSYGFSEGGALFLGSFVIIQCLLLLIGPVFKRASS